MTSSSPIVSIIIPSRNRGKSLDRCLSAIKEQSFIDYEVILVDDGSDYQFRQESKLLLQQYDQRFKLHLLHESGTKGSGASFTRNVGINLADGKYIAFCDDDDYWLRSDYLQVAVDAMEQSNAEVFFSGIEILNTAGQVIIGNMMPHIEKTLHSSQKLENFEVYLLNIDQALTYPDYAHLNITIAEKKLVNKIGGFWECSTYAEDVGFFVLLCDQANKILFRPQICAAHNSPRDRHEVSISNSLKHQDKHLLEASVYQHLLLNCNSSAALKYTQKSLAYLLKNITEELRAQGKHRAAATYARAAWGIIPTFKWGIYMLWLSLKS